MVDEDNLSTEPRNILMNRMSPSFDFTVPYLGEEYFHEATSIDESGISNWLSFEALTENLDMPMVLSPGHEPGGICMQPNYPDRQGELFSSHR